MITRRDRTARGSLDSVDVAVEAEQLGYHDVGGNDHLSTMAFVREAWAEPPDYFEPLVTLAGVAARTSVIRLSTAILMLPLRQSVLLAKQITTLDHLSGGRVTIGVAVGGYQSPLPIYSGGNADGAIRRAAELCQGWLPAKLGPDQVRAGRTRLAEYARAAGRDPGGLTTALQSVVCLGDTPEQARERFLGSSFDLFRTSLKNTMTKGVDLEAYLDLIGTPDEVCAKVAAYEEAGVDHLCGLLFVGNTVDEMRAQVAAFARQIVPAFSR
jgi:alkanesulfonate monooxygenase SsuD/methylene tetrahydromethanopterin reductase-like flavin-dependent oxidoreductase (luciferase family)